MLPKPWNPYRVALLSIPFTIFASREALPHLLDGGERGTGAIIETATAMLVGAVAFYIVARARNRWMRP